MFNLVAIALLSALATSSPSAAPSLMPTPQSLPTISVAVPKGALRLQVANTEEERERGLMSVTTLAAHTGMLFVFERDAPIEFWMKDTLIPLDMVFIAAGGKVRTVAANVPVASIDAPEANIPRRYASAMYVIELSAGEAAADGIVPGLKLAVTAEKASE